jgi:hypothetical protein
MDEKIRILEQFKNFFISKLKDISSSNEDIRQMETAFNNVIEHLKAQNRADDAEWFRRFREFFK